MFNLKKLTPIITLSIVTGIIILSLYIRLYPQRAFFYSDARDKASLLVVYNLRQQLFDQIQQQNPTMPNSQALMLASQQLNRIMHQNPLRIIHAIDQTTPVIAQQTKDPNPLYLLEADPYYYYQMTQMILNHGDLGETRGSKYRNTLMNNPDGAWQPISLHPYIGAWAYRLVAFFNPTIELMTVCAWIPLIITIACLLTFCWVYRFFHQHPLGLSVGLLAISLAPIFLKRSSLGWYDTDPYNILFMLLMLGCVLSFTQSQKNSHRYTWAILFGLNNILFALFWQGWIISFFIGFAMIGSVSLYEFLIQRKNTIPQALLFLSIGLLTTGLGISIIFGFHEFSFLIHEAISEMGKFTVKGFDLWPNLFIGVGELKKSTPQSMVHALGGWLIITITLLSVGLLIFRIIKKKTSVQEIILAGFSISTLFLALSAERFILFAIIAIALLLSWLINIYLLRPWVTPGLIAICICWQIFYSFSNISTTLNPIYNNTWHASLTWIKNNTPLNSVINTWWPPGHFIKGMANRHVIFDGASLSEGRIGFWFAKTLLNNNEQTAYGILRMINNSRNRSVELLSSRLQSTALAADHALAIANIPNDQLENYLHRQYGSWGRETLYPLVRDNQQPQYIFLYNELVEENLVLAFTGNWDLHQAEKINQHPSLLAKIPSRHSPDFIDFCWSIAGGPTKFSPQLSLVAEDDATYRFSDGLTIDKNTFTASIKSSTYGQGSPTRVFYTKNNQWHELQQQGSLNYSVLLYTDLGQTYARLAQHSLANSLLIRLYYYDAVGLTHFKKVADFHDIAGKTRIKIFEVIP